MDKKSKSTYIFSKPTAYPREVAQTQLSACTWPRSSSKRGELGEVFGPSLLPPTQVATILGSIPALVPAFAA